MVLGNPSGKFTGLANVIARTFSPSTTPSLQPNTSGTGKANHQAEKVAKSNFGKNAENEIQGDQLINRDSDARKAVADFLKHSLPGKDQKKKGRKEGPLNSVHDLNKALAGDNRSDPDSVAKRFGLASPDQAGRGGGANAKAAGAGKGVSGLAGGAGGGGGGRAGGAGGIHGQGLGAGANAVSPAIEAAGEAAPTEGGGESSGGDPFMAAFNDADPGAHKG